MRSPWDTGRRPRTDPPPSTASRPQPLVPYGQSPPIHPDTGEPLARRCAPLPRLPLPVYAPGSAAWLEACRVATRERHPPRFKAPPIRVGRVDRNPTPADLLRLREAILRRCIEAANARINPCRGGAKYAGPAVGSLLFAVGGYGPRRTTSEYRLVDPAVASELRLPSACWSAWETIGWRFRWSTWTRRAASRWMVKRGFPGARSLWAWQALWKRWPWEGVRLMTASEWAARKGRDIPDWLRSF